MLWVEGQNFYEAEFPISTPTLHGATLNLAQSGEVLFSTVSGKSMVIIGKHNKLGQMWMSLNQNISCGGTQIYSNSVNTEAAITCMKEPGCSVRLSF